MIFHMSNVAHVSLGVIVKNILRDFPQAEYGTLTTGTDECAQFNRQVRSDGKTNFAVWWEHKPVAAFVQEKDKGIRDFYYTTCAPGSWPDDILRNVLSYCQEMNGRDAGFAKYAAADGGLVRENHRTDVTMEDVVKLLFS